MIKYWKTESFVLIAAISPFIRAIPGVAAGFLSAVALLFAVWDFVIVRWGHLTVKQFAPRHVWMGAGIIGVFVGIVSLMLAFDTQTYTTALIFWFLALFGLFLGFCGAGVAIMRNE